MLKIPQYLLVGLSVFFSVNVYAASFTESFQQLRTPGLGYQESIDTMPSQAEIDSCSFNDNSTNLDNAGLKAGSKYVRMMWQDFEPTDDNFQFVKLDQIIECAHNEGKSIDLRVMLSWPGNSGPEGLPVWLINKGINVQYDGNGVSVPDWDNQTFLDEHAELINALGNKYDGHKDVNSIDIGSVGYYGEWHYYPNTGLMPSPTKKTEIIELYYTAFPNTPKVPLEAAYSEPSFNNNPVYDHLINKTDIAWRGDSWGAQEPGYPDYFNNRYDDLHDKIPNAWKDGIVVLEISGDGMDTWPGNNNISALSDSIAFAEKWHTSQIHTKLGGFPSSYISDLIELEKKLGFRFVLRSSSNNSNVSAGTSLNVSMTWDNEGLAPSYRDFRIAFRLRNNSNDSIVDTNISSTSVKGWLPNLTKNITANYNISSQVSPGTYSLDTALVFHSDVDTLLPIAVTQSRTDKWVSLGNVTVSAASNNSSATIQSVNVPVNQSNKGNIYDNSLTSSWNNDGNLNTANFTVTLDDTYLISKILYKDQNDRKMRIIVNGVDKLNNWLSIGAPLNSSGHYELTLSPPVSSSQIQFENIEDNWIVPADVTVIGELDSGPITGTGIDSANIQNVSVPVNEASKNNIIDNSLSSSWNNNGNLNTANFTVTLDDTYLITKVLYKDQNDRKMRIIINGQDKLNNWLSIGAPINSSGHYELTLSPPVASSQIRFENIEDNWIVPADVTILY